MEILFNSSFLVVRKCIRVVMHRAKKEICLELFCSFL